MGWLLYVSNENHIYEGNIGKQLNFLASGTFKINSLQIFSDFAIAFASISKQYL